jgi:thioesterase domain-containing protein
MVIMISLGEFLDAAQEKMDYPKRVHLKLGLRQIGDEGAKAIAMVLQSGHCPQGLRLYLRNNRIGNEGAKAIAMALQSGHCPQGLRLYFRNNRIGNEGAKAIAMALQSGHCPQGLRLYLINNRIGAEGAKAIAMALQSGHCQQGLQLDLIFNQIGAEGAKAIATALQSGHCPQGLRLYLRNNRIGNEGAKALKEAWEIYHFQQREKNGRTALTVAAERDYLPVAQCLMQAEQPADLNAAVAEVEALKQELQQKHVVQSETKPDRTVKAVSTIEPIIEKLLADILGLQGPWDKTEKFTVLGGNPEKWRTLLQRLQDRFFISLQDISYNATIAQLAADIEEKLKASENLFRYYVPSQQNNTKQKPAGLILIHPIAGGINQLDTLSYNIDKTVLEEKNLSILIWRSPLLNKDFNPENDHENYNSLCTMARQAELAIAGIRAVQPHGPYYLCGWSYGGVLTVEIARQLQAQGEKIKYIGLIDPQTPDQLRALSQAGLKKRLLMHINYISGLMLQHEGPFIREAALDVEKEGIELIKHAFEITLANLKTYEENTSAKKLKSILYALQANYLAIYNYYCHELLSGNNKLPAITVYVASDKANDLDKKEYTLHDFAGITDVKLTEPVVSDTNHFDIVIKPQFANLFTKHIHNIYEIILTNKLWRHLEKHYQTLKFTSLQFLYDDYPFNITDCESYIQSHGNNKTMASLFDETDVFNHVLITGKAGIGKTTAMRSLTLKNISYKIWPQKKWIFTIDLHEVRSYSQAKEHPLVDNHTAIERLLYHHFFKKAGISFEQVTAFWKFIKKEPQAICFILDGIDEVIAETALYCLWQALFSQGLSIIVSTRDYDLNQLRELGFSPALKFTVEEFKNDHYIQAFIKNYYQQLNKEELGQALWQRLQQSPILQAFCQTPLYLTMVCSIWNHHSSELNNKAELKLAALLEICIKNMFRRYLQRSNQVDLLQLNNLSERAKNQLTANVTRFLELCAFDSIKNNQTIISADKINHYLAQFNDEPDFFKKALISGFIYPVNYAYFDIDRNFQFNSQAIQLYFACQYVHHHFLANLQNNESEQTADYQILGDFIRHAIQQFDIDLIKAFIIDPLKEAKNTRAFAYLLNLFNQQIQNYYEINTLKFIAYCCEAAYELEFDNPIIGQLIDKIGKVFYCFTSKFANAYNLNEQKNNPDIDSYELQIYKAEVQSLAPQCQKLAATIKQNKAYKCSYKSQEGVLHYAIKIQDVGLLKFLLKLNANTEAKNENSERPIDIANEYGFKEGIDVISEHRAEMIYQCLRHGLKSNSNAITTDADNLLSEQQYNDEITHALQAVINDVIRGALQPEGLVRLINRIRTEVTQEYIKRWRAPEESNDKLLLDNGLSNILKDYVGAENNNSFNESSFIEQALVKPYLEDEAIIEEAIIYFIKTNQYLFFKDSIHLYLENILRELKVKFKSLYNAMILKILNAEQDAYCEQDRNWALDEMITQCYQGQGEEEAVTKDLQVFIKEAIAYTFTNNKAADIFNKNKSLFLLYFLEKIRLNTLSDQNNHNEAFAQLIEVVSEKYCGGLINKEIAKKIIQHWPEDETRDVILNEVENRLHKKNHLQQNNEKMAHSEQVSIKESRLVKNLSGQGFFERKQQNKVEPKTNHVKCRNCTCCNQINNNAVEDPVKRPKNMAKSSKIEKLNKKGKEPTSPVQEINTQNESNHKLRST